MIGKILSFAAVFAAAASVFGGEWQKYGKEPVMGGGELGTIFDIAVLKTNKGYEMFSSWRPQKSIAVHYSKDGKKWTSPVIVLPYQDEGWQFRLNRPCVLVKDGGALCCGSNESNAGAVEMIAEKSCLTFIGSGLFGKCKPINPIECLLMRVIYLKKYSKQAE